MGSNNILLKSFVKAALMITVCEWCNSLILRPSENGPALLEVWRLTIPNVDVMAATISTTASFAWHVFAVKLSSNQYSSYRFRRLSESSTDMIIILETALHVVCKVILYVSSDEAENCPILQRGFRKFTVVPIQRFNAQLCASKHRACNSLYWLFGGFVWQPMQLSTEHCKLIFNSSSRSVSITSLTDNVFGSNDILTLCSHDNSVLTPPHMKISNELSVFCSKPVNEKCRLLRTAVPCDVRYSGIAGLVCTSFENLVAKFLDESLSCRIVFLIENISKFCSIFNISIE